MDTMPLQNLKFFTIVAGILKEDHRTTSTRPIAQRYRQIQSRVHLLEVFEQLLHSGGQVKEKVLETALNLRSKVLARKGQVYRGATVRFFSNFYSVLLAVS